jgi:hypothetical protein
MNQRVREKPTSEGAVPLGRPRTTTEFV